jgi:DNA-binding transcriptional LysR family regulator
MINFRQIEVFRAIMITKSLSGAAKLLHVTQPGLSRTLKHMEMQLNLRLFERKKGRLHATSEAEEIFEEVQSIHKGIENLEWTIKKLSNGEGSTLRIAASPSIGRKIVPSVLKLLKDEMPHVKIKFDILSVDQTTDYVVLKQGDCAVTLFNIEHPAIEVTPLCKGELVCVIPQNYELANSPIITADDLINVPLISFNTHSPHGKVVQQFFGEAGIKREVDIQVRFAETACALVEQGLGVALLDEFTAKGGKYSNIVVKPVKTDHNFTVNLLTHFSSPLSTSATCFQEKLTSFLNCNI